MTARSLRTPLIAVFVLCIASVADAAYSGSVTASKNSTALFRYDLSANFTYLAAEKPDSITVEKLKWNGSAYVSDGYINSPSYTIANTTATLTMTNYTVNSATTYKWRVTLWKGTTSVFVKDSNELTFP